MITKENIISAINNCSNMHALNQIYNDILKCNDKLQLTDVGGYHGLLFLLKSLDLDLRCGNAPFTIFGYNETFSKLNLI